MRRSHEFIRGVTKRLKSLLQTYGSLTFRENFEMMGLPAAERLLSLARRFNAGNGATSIRESRSDD